MNSEIRSQFGNLGKNSVFQPVDGELLVIECRLNDRFSVRNRYKKMTLKAQKTQKQKSSARKSEYHTIRPD